MKYASVLAVICAIFYGLSCQAQPGLINYQGRLLDAQGAPVSGTISVQVRLYAGETGGVVLWQQAKSVEAVNGLYSFNFGDGEMAAVLDAPQIWLELVVNNEPMSPRQRLVSVPYALAAERIADAGNITGGTLPVERLSPSVMVPIGSIMAWHKNLPGVPSLPSGFAECNGQVINDTNSPLHGQTLPDLNGGARFLRGGSTSGTLQADQNKAHTHAVDPPSTASTSAGDHAHSVDPPDTATTSGGSHTHSVDPPNTTTSNHGGHDHNQRVAANCNSGGSAHRGSFNPSFDCQGLTQYSSGTQTEWGGAHTHTLDIAAFTSGSAGSHTHNVNIAAFNSASAGAHTHSTDIPSFTSGSQGGDEVRVVNMSVVWIMRIK